MKIKKNKSNPVFKCTPNGAMQHQVNGKLIPKIITKKYSNSKQIKTKEDDNNLQNHKVS